MIRGESLQLRRYNSFGVDAVAHRAIQLESPDDLGGLAFDPAADLVLGAGSNTLFTSDTEGAVYLNRIGGKRVVEVRGSTVVVEAGGGEVWQSLVLWTLSQGLSGLENLSLIPGLVGAAPVQNIGAYGVELSERLESVEAWDWREGELVRLDRDECGFGYRDSRFKSAEPARWLITSIRLCLDMEFRPNLSYAGLGEQLDRMGVETPDAALVSRAVIALRKSKLPNPARLGNAGSFFTNPVISRDRAEALQRDFDGLPVHPAGDESAKLSAAWMIENCGWKGHRQGNAGVSDRHALVLVNHGGATGMEILDLARRVAASVEKKFGVALTPEPRIVGDRWD